jgi:hypothetical protein
MGGKRPGSGRKAIQIDLALLEKVCTLQCTDVELAGFFDVNVRTIERHKKKPAFAATMERGRAKGRLSVRRNLFEQAAKGNSQSTIFLAKNLLGFKDFISNEHSGPEGSPIPLSYVEILNTRRNSLAQRKLKESGNGTSALPSERAA